MTIATAWRSDGRGADRLKIGLYLEHGVGNGVGGAELAMAHLASVWSTTDDVDLIHHRPPLTRERLARFSAEEARSVNVRCVSRDDEPPASANPFQRYRSARSWHRQLSAGYDLFLACTHWVPPFCHARAGALLVLFPFYVRPGDTAQIQLQPAWKRARHRAYHDFEWRRRLATYQYRFAISDYARAWTARRWGIDCEVVYPPVDIAFGTAEKEPLILSVGRFSTRAHTKKQLEMMHVFSELSGGPASGWAYASVGGLNTRSENRVYFDRVRQAGRGFPTRVEANLDRRSVRALFERARIFWHATGLDDDTDAHPELAEHFGIATVEAMAAGAVPVVIDKGGQREIVEHGRTGFLWTTVEELKAYTCRLIADEALWRRMSAAAREGVARFASERFVRQLSRACQVKQPRDRMADASIDRQYARAR